MKAVRLHAHGGPEALLYEDAPDPVPGPGEVLVRVKAVSVNHLDLFVRRGMPGVKVPFPRIPGADIAGIVESCGQAVEGIEVGSRVVIAPGLHCGDCEYCHSGEESCCLSYGILGEHTDGGYAELAAVPARNVIPLPEAVSMEEAAAVPLVFLTAWRMVFTRARLKPGEDILVLAAGSGVGTAVIQMAKLAGARVIATASSPEKLDRALELGADVAFNYTEEPFPKRIRELTNKRGVDVVIDSVGKETWVGSLKSLSRNGRLVTCGATTGFDPQTDLRHIFYRQLQIYGSTMGSRKELDDSLRCFFRGQLKAVIHRVLPLSEAPEAHRILERREVFGKVVLTP